MCKHSENYVFAFDRLGCHDIAPKYVAHVEDFYKRREWIPETMLEMCLERYNSVFAVSAPQEFDVDVSDHELLAADFQDPAFQAIGGDSPMAQPPTRSIVNT